MNRREAHPWLYLFVGGALLSACAATPPASSRTSPSGTGEPGSHQGASPAEQRPPETTAQPRTPLPPAQSIRISSGLVLCAEERPELARVQLSLTMNEELRPEHFLLFREWIETATELSAFRGECRPRELCWEVPPGLAQDRSARLARFFVETDAQSFLDARAEVIRQLRALESGEHDDGFLLAELALSSATEPTSPKRQGSALLNHFDLASAKSTWNELRSRMVWTFSGPLSAPHLLTWIRAELPAQPITTTPSPIGKTSTFSAADASPIWIDVDTGDWLRLLLAFPSTSSPRTFEEALSELGRELRSIATPLGLRIETGRSSRGLRLEGPAHAFSAFLPRARERLERFALSESNPSAARSPCKSAREPHPETASLTFRSPFLIWLGTRDSVHTALGGPNPLRRFDPLRGVLPGG